MKTLFLVSIFLILLQSCKHNNSDSKKDLTLWYNQPAHEWVEALPIGNGRMGAMVFGGTDLERIQLNEESLWTGGVIERANPEAKENLEKVRKLLFERKYAEGDRLAQEKIMGKRIERGLHTYQTLGDLYIEYNEKGDIKNYKRELDLENAIVTTSFEKNQVNYTSEVFASKPNQIIVVKLKAGKKGALNFSTWLERPGNAEKFSIGENQILMTGFAEYEGKGTAFASLVQLKAKNGNISAFDNKLLISNADEVEFRISARTNYWGDSEVKSAATDIQNTQELNFNDLKPNHISS